MVFVIFWRGTEAFSTMLQSLESCGSPIEALNEARRQHQYQDDRLFCETPELFRATQEFVNYTKYLLQTMQLSCSTALLSLYYLHRLRPRVQHMFVPGTFHAPPTGNERPSSATAAEKPRYQYRRDPKLEYRLFTISIILANKVVNFYYYYY